MGCELVCGRQIKMCGAFNSHLVLSLEELEQRCQTPVFQSCKIYQMCKQKGAKLPLKEYRQDYLMTQV
jgi:hypothetical protein